MTSPFLHLDSFYNDLRHLDFSTQLFPDPTACRIASRLQRIVEGFCEKYALYYINAQRDLNGCHLYSGMIVGRRWERFKQQR